jgi:5-oxoprolinase (ATP-hydrolysing) subunit A
MRMVDLNCDMGESFGAWRMGSDAAVMPFVTSTSIACGYHGGDPSVMRETVRLAMEHNVAIGAHPSFQDLAGFGRREMHVSAQEAYDLVVYQIGALSGFVRAAGGTMRHVKPHGALYNMAARNVELAESIANAVLDVDPSLVLYGLSGSELTKAGERAGLRVAHEAFADRTYRRDGQLTSRRLPNAMISDAERSAKQVLRMVTEGRVATIDGGEVELRADTICLHGDATHAVEFARRLRERLKSEGIEVRPVWESVAPVA